MRYTFITQPIVFGNTPVSYEILVRGIDDRGKLLPAPDVLSWAESDEDIIRQIDLDALEVAIASAAKKIPHHVNISPATMGHPEYLAALGEYLLEGGNPSYIVVEISEDIEPSPDRRNWISYIQSMGFDIALDDFGRCHGNNHALALYRPAVLKVDGEIIKYVSDSYYSGIIKKDLGFCQDEGIICIAECVENPIILKTLNLLCDRIGFKGIRYQGWHFGVGEPCNVIFGE